MKLNAPQCWNRDAQQKLEWLLEDRARKVPAAWLQVDLPPPAPTPTPTTTTADTADTAAGAGTAAAAVHQPPQPQQRQQTVPPVVTLPPTVVQQGRWGTCSYHVLARAVSDVLRFKYEQVLEHQALYVALTQKLGGFRRARWPDELADELGTLIVETPDSQLHLKISCHQLHTFSAVGRQAHRACGCAHVIVVTRWPIDAPKEDSLHTMSATRWLHSDRVLCLNTHGDSDAFPNVTRQSFHSGFWVDVRIQSCWAPGPGGDRSEFRGDLLHLFPYSP
jgi:hypothetical protein